MKRLRKWRHAAGVLVGLVILGACGASAAQAEFAPPYTTQCSGSRAELIETGLESSLTGTWTFNYEAGDTTSPLACPERESRVREFSATSSEALAALGSETGVRNREYIFAGSEEPPTLKQWLRIDLGDKPGEDSGLIRQIPTTITAVVPLVHFPEGCSIPAKEATADGRFTVSNAQLDKAYAGAISKWGELLPDIAASCASLPIKRVVPKVSDGTTYVLKQWLNTVNASRGWPESSSMPNTSWPNDSGATATIRSEQGDFGEAQEVGLTSGSIGFASLPAARIEGFGAFAPENPSHVANGRFWLSVVNGAGQRVEPTRDPKSGADNVKGANCDNPTFSYVPSGYDTTATPIWRSVSAAGSKTGWPICTLAYYLAWDDASTVFGNTTEVEAQQRTVKDYLAYVLGVAGQTEAHNSDYSALPTTLLADAQDGQSRVGWNKVPGSKEASQAAVKSSITADEKHS